MGHWTHAEIGGKRADLFEPDRPAEAGFVVLFLHGYAGITLKDNAAYSHELDRYGLRAVCPHAPRSWWGDLVYRDFDPQVTPLKFLHGPVREFIAARWNAAPPAIALAGVSMGGQGALRLAYRYPQEFPVVAAISPVVDFHIWHGRGLSLDEIYPSSEAARQDTVTVQLHPLNWPRHQLLTCDPADTECFEGAQQLASKLASSGIPFERDFQTSGGGHSWTYFDKLAPQVLKFVFERLEQERRRVP
jgi:pimeloyl-ACP methyl ester carboxylesterase